jgi:TPR repeat protein
MKHLTLTLLLIFGATASIAEYKIALKELENLAKQGDLNAQIKLANGYRKGIGVAQDYKIAVKWFTFAAKQGNASAQYNLGIMHSFGLGVIQDYETSLKWYILSAEQGNTFAQYNLGRLYYLGHGVKEDMIYAHMWTNLASLNGFEMSINLRGLITEQMTPSQIDKAHELARECVANNYKRC